MMLSGGLLAWFVLLPLFDLIGGQSNQVLFPGTVPISQMTSDDIWNFYIRYMRGESPWAWMSLIRRSPAASATSRLA
jgi:hypothetical protein